VVNVVNDAAGFGLALGCSVNVLDNPFNDVILECAFHQLVERHLDNVVSLMFKSLHDAYTCTLGTILAQSQPGKPALGIQQ
jgi:hypothetical protein